MSPLLDCMHQFVCQKPLTLLAARRILPGGKVDLAAAGKGVGAECLGRGRGLRIRVDADVRKIIVEAGLHEGPSGTIQLLAR